MACLQAGQACSPALWWALYPGGVHGFNGMPGLPIAEEADRRVDAFLAAAVED